MFLLLFNKSTLYIYVDIRILGRRQNQHAKIHSKIRINQLVIGWKRFRGTKKEDDCGPPSIHSSLLRMV